MLYAAPGLDYDLDAARREIALARQEGGVPDEIEYRYNAGFESHKQIAEYFQAAWARIGVRARITAQEWNSLLDDTRKGDFEIVRFGDFGNVSDPESDFLLLFRCASPDNRVAHTARGGLRTAAWTIYGELAARTAGRATRSSARQRR